jgi:hypothetical protein
LTRPTDTGGAERPMHAHAHAPRPPPWSAARGQDRETRELLLLPSLRATDSCFESSPATKPHIPPGRRLAHVRQS